MPDLSLARKVLQTEAAAVRALVDRVDERFVEAVSLIRRLVAIDKIVRHA